MTINSSSSSSSSPSTDHEWTGVELLVCALIQLVLVGIAFRLDKNSHPHAISESAYAIFFGLLFGSVLAVLSPVAADEAGLNPNVFFFGLLPPIILEAGFNMKKRGFFTNFSTILSLAIIGTLIATFLTGGVLIFLGKIGLIIQLTPAEAYLYGSLISAVDPVATLSVFKKCNAPPLLFNLVFGESVLNDGVAIVVFTLFQEYIRSGNTDVNLHTGCLVIGKVLGIGLGSVVLAALVCCSSAVFLKHADPALQQYPTYEISIILLSAYCSYLVADLAGLSGIVALFFSGVWMSHYHLYSISSESATALTHLLSTIAFLAENFIFLYLGVSVVAYSGSFYWDWTFIFVNLILCIVTRACNTFPLCKLANVLGRKEPIPYNFMIVIWFSGLRGAIAFALALNVWTKDPHHSKIMKSSTLFTVMFTTLFFGMGTSPLLQYLGLGKSPNSKLVQSDIDSELNDTLLSCHEKEQEPTKFLQSDNENSNRLSDCEDGEHSNSNENCDGIHSLWERLDEKYLKPILGGNPRKKNSMKTVDKKWEQ